MKTTISLLVLFGVVLGGGYWYSQHNTQQAINQYSAQTPQSAAAVTSTTTTTTTTRSTTDTPAARTPASTPAAGSYSLAQVATHNTSGNCWTAIDGNVYNLTDWINQHPGGAARILSICGKDGSSAFDEKHGSDPRAKAALANFKIGAVAS